MGFGLSKGRDADEDASDAAFYQYACVQLRPKTGSGPSASYAGRIKARIKPNVVLTGSVAGNPTATVEVRLAPDGTIIGRTLLKSSGSPLWDETALRAIAKTEILPRDTDGRVPASFTIDFRPQE